jgi:hypothetical protein
MLHYIVSKLFPEPEITHNDEFIANLQKDVNPNETLDEKFKRMIGPSLDSLNTQVIQPDIRIDSNVFLIFPALEPNKGITICHSDGQLLNEPAKIENVYYQGNIKDTVYRVFFPKDVLDDKMKCDLSFEVYMKCFLKQIMKNFKNIFDECDFFVGDRFCRYEDLNGQIFHIREEIEDDIVKLYYELRLINSTISTDNMKLLNEDEFQTFIKERGI